MAVTATIAHFDPLGHVGEITGKRLLQIGGSEWLTPLRDALAGEVEEYSLTHKGTTDHDGLDVWLLGQLGAARYPRMWAIERLASLNISVF